MSIKRASLSKPICHLCAHSRISLLSIRYSSSSSSPPEAPTSKSSLQDSRTEEPKEQPEEPDSALARRFESLATSALESSPRKASKIASENAFSPELKDALATRIAAADFSNIHAQAISVANLPSTAGKHTRDIAASPPWTGTESTSDSVLRMLVDTHKPLRGELAKKPTSAAPANIDLGPRRRDVSGTQRVARAREKSAEYTLNKEALSDSERNEIRQMFQERFLPEGRSMAASLQALASLADERIEEARARGQFRNLPRGKPLEQDHNANSPFLDTTEYFLNKIIQKQEIMPPWIEKQQELARALAVFRKSVRREWRRHVAMAIASRGGSIEEQCRIAEKCAKAERRRVRIEERTRMIQRGETDLPPEEIEEGGDGEVFRDPAWEKAEFKYHQLSIDNLNAMTRSYNLMAPELAKKPYFNLERELSRCFADCAPLIVAELRERAKIPTGGDLGLGRKRLQGRGGGSGVLGKFAGETAVIKESTKPNYGFREFWRDLFGFGGK